jgi:hypothetical protein
MSAGQCEEITAEMGNRKTRERSKSGAKLVLGLSWNATKQVDRDVLEARFKDRVEAF